MISWNEWLESQRSRREQAGLARELRPLEGSIEPVVFHDGKRLVNLSSNNYLGLASHPSLIEAAARGAAGGAGAGSSRLVVGSSPEIAAVEEKIAAFKGSERALLLGSGYLANIGTIAALCDRDCEIFSDRLNHASIVDGVRISGARASRYRHCDLDHLESLLKRSNAARKLIVTDTVFSMDGDTAPLAGLVELRDRYGALLLIDDAHAGGVLGPHGEGFAYELGFQESVDLTMGTFSKAFGVYGAYLSGSRTLVDHLVSTCRTLIYSTALPPGVVSSIDASIDLVREADDRRLALAAKSERFRRRLVELGFDVAGSSTQIVPAIAGSSERALDLASSLDQDGVLAVAIRPPTVPSGAARIRFSVMATHADEDLELALEAMERAGGIPGQGGS